MKNTCIDRYRYKESHGNQNRHVLPFVVLRSRAKFNLFLLSVKVKGICSVIRRDSPDLKSALLIPHIVEDMKNRH